MEKSSTSTAAMICVHIGHSSRENRLDGRSHTAASAASDASNQFDTNDRAVNQRFAERLVCFHGPAMNIGTAVSIKAAAAMTVRMTLTLARKARSDIGPPVPEQS